MRQQLANGLIINSKQIDDGRVCIHWLVEDEAGPIKQGGAAVDEKCAVPIPPGFDAAKMGVIRTRFVGRIACNPEQNSVHSRRVGNEIFMCHRSEDPRAVTCPLCMATEEYEKALEALGVGTLSALEEMSKK